MSLMMNLSRLEEFKQLILTKRDKIKGFYEILLEKLLHLNERFGFFHSWPSEDQLENFIARVEKSGNEDMQYYPVSVKDNICTKDLETTAGSRILDGYVPPFDATVVKRMKDGGGIIIGKTTMDEFGFGTFSLNSAHEIPRNAFDSSRVAGGSSGGAAVLTALLSHHIALAVSTGGSISCPAAFNGVIGFTPTYGVVSRWGLIDYANSLDKIGLMGRDINDIERAFSRMVGRDAKDATLVDYHLHSKNMKKNGLKPLKVAILDDVIENCDPLIVKSFWKAMTRLQEEQLIEITHMSITHYEFSVAAYYIIATAEVSTNLARYCGLRYGKLAENFEDHFDEFFTRQRSQFFGMEAKRRIVLGTFARMAGYRDKYYLKAMKIRRALIEEIKEIFRGNDLIATPTMPILAPKIEDARSLSPIEVYALDILTIPPNLCGFPHASFPIDHEPSPIGCQFIANHFQESTLFHVGRFWKEMFPLKEPKDHVNVLDLMENEI